MTSGPREFLGTDRFQLLRCLGSGGMGIVYAALDRDRNETVALKTLRHADPSLLYRFKKEFRSLADIVHPNLVPLYELVADETQCFFTMELLQGSNFLEYISASDASSSEPTDDSSPTQSRETLDGSYSLESSEMDLPFPSDWRADMARLRWALGQLATGIGALHDAGILHRDIKPSNVLVTDTGRLLILDFGLVSELGSLRTAETAQVVGTPAYMAPEQADGRSTAAGDWYSAGVLLYQALTGSLPYRGSPMRILLEKQRTDPVHPNRITPGLPGDLVELCMALLARDPASRPGGREILDRLGLAPGLGSRGASVGARSSRRVIGRSSQIAALEDAFRLSRNGRAMSVHVYGPSGIGKTTLIQEFVDRLAPKDEVLVLSGRCHVRELVPYNGLDGVVDDLSQFLRGLPERELRGLRVPHLTALTRVFPVLLRVANLSSSADVPQEVPDLVELRRRAFGALRGLLRRICAMRPVIVFIDDLQWADPDTINLLMELFNPPDPPPILMVTCFRSEEVDHQGFLRSLLAAARPEVTRRLPLEPLTLADTRALARHLLGVSSADFGACIGTIERESAGSPFLIEQLARFVSRGDPDAAANINLSEMLETRVSQLQEGARRLLEVLAVANRPMDSAAARQSAGLEEDERPLVSVLCREHLLRVTGAGKRLEFFHDRIREQIASWVPRQKLPDIHRRIARAMESSSIDDPEALFQHCLGAEEHDRAATHAERAAAKAASALAFDRASEFYRRALELGRRDRDRDLQLRVALAECLVNAGRGVDAARAFMTASQEAESGRALDLRRKAAEQWLRSGHVDEGLSVLRSVLSAVRLRFARTPKVALLRILGRRALIRLRGLRFSERREAELESGILQRLDVCWAVVIGLARIDNIHSVYFQTKHLLLALRAGEPYRVVRAVATEAALVSTAGGRARRRALELVGMARELAERIEHPHAIGLAQLAAATASFYLGEFEATRGHCERGARLFREKCTGVAWELNTLHSYTVSSLVYLGEWKELSRVIPVWLRHAREMGDLYAAADLAAGRSNVVWLAGGDVMGARDAFAEAMRSWSVQGFHFQHYVSLVAEAQIELYAGGHEAAWSRITASWPALARSLMLRIQQIRVEATHLRARAALAFASSGTERDRLVRSAERDARCIARESMPWSNPLAELILAAVCSARNDRERSNDLLARCIRGFDTAGMSAYAAAASFQRAKLLGGSEGEECMSVAMSWMKAQNIAEPERIADMLAPGFLH